MNVFPEVAKRMKKRKHYQFFRHALRIHWMYADGFVGKICCPYAMKYGFPVYAGKHFQSDIGHVIGFKNMLNLFHSFL